MRRLTSLFRRSDKSDTTTVSSASSSARSDLPSKSPSVKKQSRFLRSLSIKSVQPALVRDPPPVPKPPLQAYSSSSSSTDSPAPATPDDDSEIGPSISDRRSNPWSERKLPPPLSVTGGSLGWDIHSPDLPPIPTIAKSYDSEDLDDESSATSSSPSVSSPQPVSPHTLLHSLTTYALAPTFSAPPLLQLPNVPLFPRSVNLVSTLPSQETTASTLHRTQLLRRLARRDLSVSEERSITSFTSRRTLPARSRSPLPKSGDGTVCDVKRVGNVSQGLKRWISRPCFEDRMSVYAPGPSGRSDDILVHRVVGGALGVAALEVSETIEILAGYNVEERSEIPWLATLSSPSTTDLELPVSVPATASALNAQGRNQPYKPSPSPLRIEATPLSSDQAKALKTMLPSSQPAPVPVSPSSTSPVNITAPRKRTRSSVRFDVEEKQDRDDHVPLGQVMRIKRGREERAKFLELEKERRALEEERLRHEAEKKKWEQEKRAWEAGRTTVEDEKQKRLYQQEVIAARKRRESQMFKVGSSTDLPEIEPQNSRRQSSYSRPVYDTQRRESSDGSSPPVSHPPSRNDSFNSLRGTSKPQSLHSAPPPSLKSSHTASSIEDVVKMKGLRTSMLPVTPPQLPMVMQPYGYSWGIPVMPQMQMPMQMPMQMSMPMQMQMVPQVPYYAMDNMPLLPPTAPFMMQRVGDRRQSSSSSSPNRNSTSLGKSASQSADRLPLNQGPSSTRRPAGHQRSSSGGSSPNQLGQGQRSNQGSINSSRRSTGIVDDPNQWRKPATSRPPLPHGNSQGSGSWVVPSPGAQRRQNTVS